VKIIAGIFIAVFVGACIMAPAQFQCQSGDPEFCEKEIKAHYEIRRLELEIKRDKQCRFIHGSDSVICR